MLLEMVHESLNTPESRGTSSFSAAENAAEGGLRWVRRKIFRFYMALEEELPAELDTLTENQNSSVVTFLLLFVQNHPALERTLFALPVAIGAVHASRPLSFLHGFFEITYLKSPCTFAETCKLVRFAWKKLFWIYRHVCHDNLQIARGHSAL